MAINIIRRRANPSRQYMFGKLFDYQQRLALLKATVSTPSSERTAVIEACEHYLEAIEEAMTPSIKNFSGSKIFAAWHLFHRLDETFYLLMDKEELAAQGAELLQGLKNSTLPQQTKSDCIARVEKQLEGLNRQPGAFAGEQAAHSFKSAAYMYNDFVDNLFWDIWCKKLISLVYTVLLGCLVVSLFFVDEFSINLRTVLVLGAMGGLGSGIFTTLPISIAYGHFWSSVVYQTLIRPLQGAMAALMIFWLIQSQYLIVIDPPLEPGTVIVSRHNQLPSEFPLIVQTPEEGCLSDDRPFNAVSSAKSSNGQTIVLKAAHGMQIYLYLLVLLITGFIGDKVLMMVTDKVGNKLLANAEKTKEAKEG